MKVSDQIVSNPKYMIVGEAPGSEEARLGTPFVGKAGQQLDRLLLAAGILREECYITNVTDEQPPKNDFGIYYQDRQRREPTIGLCSYWDAIRRKLDSARPKVCVVLGNEALRAITGFRGIEARRGSLYQVGETHVVPTFHPSAILRGGGTSAWYLPATIHDLKRAKAVSENREHSHYPTLAILEDAKQLDAWFHSASERGLPIAFDIETTYKGGEWIKCIGLACSKDEGIVVPFPQEGIGQEYFDLQQILKKWMTSGLIKWIGQNAFNFDIPYIQRMWGFELKGLWVDTMVLHHMLHPEFPHDLATISSFYTTIPYWKDQSGNDLYKYCAFDVVATFIDCLEMVEEAKKVGLWKLYENYYGPLLTPLRKISQRGIRIDKVYQKEMRNVLKHDIKNLQSELDGIYQQYTNADALKLRLRGLQRFAKTGRKTIRLWNEKKQKNTSCRVASQIKTTQAAIEKKESLNVRSTKDLAHFLYTVLGLPVKTKMGKITTDETALNQLFIKTNHPFLKTMIKLRQKRNTLSRWGNLKTDENDLISTTYSFAETGRLKSGRFEAK